MAIKITNEQMKVMRKIIYAVETGGQVYGNQRYDDFTEAATNTTNETAITIGAGQWYATEAQRLLRRIRMADETLFNQLDNAEISKDIDSANWSKYAISKTSNKAKCIIKIISTTVGIECQDKLIEEQIEEFTKEIFNLGVEDIKAIMMCINIRHLGGLSAVKRILGKAKKPYTIDSIFTSLKSDQQDSSSTNQVGDKLYWSRHEKVYRWINEKVIIESDGDKMANNVNTVINIALNEEGYIEKASNSNLDNKTANKGTNNYTKYSRDINNLGLMGCQGQPWCGTIQFWLEVQAYGLTQALKNWNMTKSSYVGYNCFSTYNAFEKVGKVSKTPKLGCLVIFTFSHMGRVVNINGNTFTTLEGNTSSNTYERNGGMVKKKTYNVNDSKIKGFCIIDYDSNDSSASWKAIGTATCTGDDVNFRATPNGTKIGVLNKGNRFEVDGTKSGEWVHAKVSGIGIGYIHENYVKYDTVVTPEIIDSNMFTDVYKNDYYYDAVKWAVEKNITKGITSTKFAPNNDCTRGDAVTFLWRFYGCPEPVMTKNQFIDIAVNDYYYKAVLWAVEKGITTGLTETRFAPKDIITRGQIVTMIWRSKGKPSAVLDNQFTDLGRDAYYYDAVLWAAKNKITTGYTNDIFAPDMSCTRGQVVTFLYRIK